MAEVNPFELPWNDFMAQYAPDYEVALRGWLATNPTESFNTGAGLDANSARLYTNVSTRAGSNRKVDITDSYFADPSSFDAAGTSSWSVLNSNAADKILATNEAPLWEGLENWAGANGYGATFQNLNARRAYVEAKNTDWLDIAGNALIQIAGNYILPGFGTAISQLSQEKNIDPWSVGLSALTGTQGSLSTVGTTLTAGNAANNIANLGNAKENMRESATFQTGSGGKSSANPLSAFSSGVDSLLSGSSNVTQVGGAAISSLLGGGTKKKKKQTEGDSNGFSL